MNSIEITGALRSDKGKKAVKALRKESLVPCVLYGGGDNITFSVPEINFKKLIYTPEVYLVKLEIDGNVYESVMKEIQFHPVTDKILHIDFLRTFPDKPVVMDIPVKIEGTSEGKRAGGQQVLKSRTVAVKALPADLPDAIKLDVTPLLIGQDIRIRDLNIKGVEFLDPENNVIVAVRVTRVVVEEEPEVEAAEGEGEGEGEGETGESATPEGDAKAEKS